MRLIKRWFYSHCLKRAIEMYGIDSYAARVFRFKVYQNRLRTNTDELSVYDRLKFIDMNEVINKFGSQKPTKAHIEWAESEIK